jgi:site-specific DNA-methyltransferase (adenine-specific)
VTPYYSDDLVTIYHGDSLELLSAWPGPIVDTIVTDPPYASGATETAKRGKRAAATPESVTDRPTIDLDDMGSAGHAWVSRRWLMWARAITRKGGHLACFTDWRMSAPMQTLLEAAGWRLTNLVVWDKGYPGLGSGFRAQHEFVVVASNGQPEWQSYDYGNVLKSMRLTDTDHPHEKPVDLLTRLIHTTTPVGGVVLDAFMGSGSTLVAAKITGRRAIGIEIEERYCEIAARRCSQDVLGLSA